MKGYRILMLILTAIIAVMCLLLAIVSKWAWIPFAISVFGFVYFLKFYQEKTVPTHRTPRITAAYVDTHTGPADPPEGIPSAKPRKQVTTKVAGVTFKCDLDRNESRQEILEGVYEGDYVELQEYEYKGSPAFYVIDTQTGLDIGNIPADVAQKISQFDNPIYEAYVTRRGSFEPDDDRDPVEYCEVRIYVI